MKREPRDTPIITIPVGYGLEDLLDTDDMGYDFEDVIFYEEVNVNFERKDGENRL